jgi:hypothetical protein
MRRLAARDAILREEFGYTDEMIDSSQDKYGQLIDERLKRVANEKDAEIDAKAGF